MSQYDFRCDELDAFVKNLEKIPKEQAKKRKQFMRKQGTQLRRATVRLARNRIKKTAVNRKRYQRVAGQYHKSIKRGRWYSYGDGADCIRVYSSDPIAHLIELGYTPVLRNKQKGSRVEGHEVFKDAADMFRPQFEQACTEFAAGYEAEINK